MKVKEVMINKIDLIQRVDFTSAKKKHPLMSNKQKNQKNSKDIPATINSKKKRLKSSLPRLTFNELYQEVQDYRHCNT